MSPSKPVHVINVGEADFEREVLQASHERPVVVDFWAPWCAPCRALAPILEKVIGEYQGDVILAKVNTDEAQSLAATFRIEGIPLVIAFRQGKPAAEFVGIRPEAFVRQFVQQLLPTAADKLTAEALSLESTDPARAEEQYRLAVKGDSRNEQAALGLARVLIKRGQEKEALDVLENIGPTEEAERLRAMAAIGQIARPFTDLAELRQTVDSEAKNAQARYELGCALAGQGQYPEALRLLLAAAEIDPKLAAAKVREVMVKVFQIVGLHSELANDYRDKLSTLLF